MKITLLILLFFMPIIPTKSDAGFVVTSAESDITKRVIQKFSFQDAPLGAFRYYILPTTADAPVAFKQGSFYLAKTDFAGPGEGYNDVDAHGWPCKRVRKPDFDVTYRIYRLLNEPHGAFELIAEFEVIE